MGSLKELEQHMISTSVLMPTYAEARPLSNLCYHAVTHTQMLPPYTRTLTGWTARVGKHLMVDALYVPNVPANVPVELVLAGTVALRTLGLLQWGQGVATYGE